ncbi:hypothetical protein EDC54_10462 [Samsonia erythrinae]|uniref:Uncharacterized protein n=1 Tax=Samsonia erythrinae TaxID=160434 RepID=A0A4R3VPG9_9GAMM|nr:hypothetical protein EDC54_10462 [Samsonia erythrinae]
MMFSRRFIRRSFLWRTFSRHLMGRRGDGKFLVEIFYRNTDLPQDRKVKITKRMTF